MIHEMYIVESVLLKIFLKLRMETFFVWKKEAFREMKSLRMRKVLSNVLLFRHLKIK